METQGAEFLSYFFERILPVAILCGVVVFVYISILAFVHLRARLTYEYYMQVREEVSRLRKHRARGDEVESLKGWEEVEDLLKTVLDSEGVLPHDKAEPPA